MQAMSESVIRDSEGDISQHARLGAPNPRRPTPKPVSSAREMYIFIMSAHNQV